MRLFNLIPNSLRRVYTNGDLDSQLPRAKSNPTHNKMPSYCPHHNHSIFLILLYIPSSFVSLTHISTNSKNGVP
jgi:hypothetical protein